jgi:hypothetical protein
MLALGLRRNDALLNDFLLLGLRLLDVQHIDIACIGEWRSCACETKEDLQSSGQRKPCHQSSAHLRH